MIQIKSPTRIDLAGGTLDMWPLYNFIGEGLTVNLAISISTYATLTPTFRLYQQMKDSAFFDEMNQAYTFTKSEWENLRAQVTRDNMYVIDLSDVQYFKVFFTAEELLQCPDRQLDYVKPLMHYFKPQPFYLKLKSESPVGGGLGGSSSLLISILKAFYKLNNQTIDSSDKLVYLAHNLESQILRTPTGTQDYYPAASGGVHFLNYLPNEIVSENLSLAEIPLQDNISVIYTGRSHHSGLNNFEVLKAAVEGNSTVISALKELLKIAQEMKKSLLSKDWDALPQLFTREREERLKLTPHFSSPEIEKLIGLCKQKSLGTLKICGAGGGGCVFIWHHPELRSKIKEEVESIGLKVLAAKPVNRF